MRLDTANATAAPAQDFALAIQPKLQAIVPAEFFKPHASDELLNALKTEVRERAKALDISTEEGRAAIASLAYKVARSKTALDDQRKKLVSDQKAALKVIDGEGSRIWGELEELQKEVRKPLTDWEDAEKVRVGDHEAGLALIADAANLPGFFTAADAEGRIALVNRLHDRNWQEFTARADKAQSDALALLRSLLAQAQQREVEASELARLRREETERKERERLQKVADDAAAEERRKSEERERIAREASERERQRIEAERIEAEARAKQAEAQRIEAEERSARELREAEERRVREAEYAEQKRVAAEQEAARQAQVAAERAEREKQAAIEAERKRVADEAERARLEQEKRERNKKHRKAIEEQALGAIIALGISEKLADALIAAIAAGDVPNVTINY